MLLETNHFCFPEKWKTAILLLRRLQDLRLLDSPLFLACRCRNKNEKESEEEEEEVMLHLWAIFLIHLIYLCGGRSRVGPANYPTVPFTSLEFQNPSIDSSAQHNIRLFTDLEALKLWPGRSGSWAGRQPAGWPECTDVVAAATAEIIYLILASSCSFSSSNLGIIFASVFPVQRLQQQQQQQRRAKLSVATLKKTLMESVVAAAASGGALLSFVFVA